MLKVINTAAFIVEIERLVQEESLGYIEAITHYAQTTGIDIESIPKLLTPTIKAKIKKEAISLNMLKGKKTTKLVFVDDQEG